MAIKSYAEMRKIDVLPFCDKREAKDDKGRRIEVPYLNWARCKELLHQNGAETVYFEPCVNERGSSLFMSDQVFTDSKGYTNRCYEVRVKIVIDDLEFEAQYPLMNGSNPVKDNSLTQQRVWNAQTRAFVKGVAMRTGLGFGLWLDDMDDKAEGEEDLSKHNRIGKDSTGKDSIGKCNKGKKETTHDLYIRLVPDYNIPDGLKCKLLDWIAYKIERKEAYKEQGMKSLLRQIENNQLLYGEKAVCDLIDDSMANGWKGIIFDRLKQKPIRQAPSVHGSSRSFLDLVEDDYD